MNEKGLIFTKFYAKGIQALKIWTKLTKRIQWDSNPQLYFDPINPTTLPIELLRQTVKGASIILRNLT